MSDSPLSDIRLRFDLAYDGAGFHGWAAQAGLRTVEATVSDAVTRLLRSPDPIRLTVAGRTDAGVHATGQVAHADVGGQTLAGLTDRLGATPIAILQRRLAAILPDDVQVRRVAQAPVGFDARFSALSRRYVYRIADHPGARDPLTRGLTLWEKRPLDVEAMAQAAAALIGEHDFAAFARRREGASTVRTLAELSPQRRPDGVIEIWVEADAFCHNQVRAMVGALIAVGTQRRPPTWVGEVLAAGVRDPAVVVQPPHGLTLVAVTYPAADDVAAQAAKARVFRG